MSSFFFETYLILLNCVQCLSDICVVRLAAHVSFIGKTACGVLLNKKMPARRRAQRQDASWIRRYKSLPLQNRHQVRHHLDLFILKNIRETTLVTVKEAVEQSTVFKKKVTKVFINSIFCAVPRYLVSWCFPPLRGLYHRIHKNYAEDHLLRALDIIFSYISSRETRLWLK